MVDSDNKPYVINPMPEIQVTLEIKLEMCENLILWILLIV